MDKFKRLAIFLPSLAGGGAERISVNLANHLTDQGYTVDMVLKMATGPFLGQLHPKVRIIDLQVKRMRGLLLPLVHYLRSARPQAVLACMWPLTVISVAACKLAGISTQLILAEHITWSRASQGEYSRLQRLIIRKTMRAFFPLANAIVTVSEMAAEDLACFTGVSRNKIVTIYNPVVDTTCKKKNEPVMLGVPGWASSQYKILNVGSFKEQKNHELLLRSFALLIKRVNAHLLILGEGHLRAKLEVLVGELGLRGHVSMPGFIVDPVPFYEQADLFVLSSDWEGLPTAIIESLAVGTPVVSTDCPSGPREILCGGEYGRLVPVGDAIALTAAMEAALFADYDASILVERARDFSVAKAADRYLELLFPQNPIKAQ